MKTEKTSDPDVGSTRLLGDIVDVLRTLERLCEEARGPGRHHVFMSLNAARRNVAEAGAAASLMSPNAKVSSGDEPR